MSFSNPAPVSLSFGSLLNSILASLIVGAVCCFLLRSKGRPTHRELKILSILLLAAGLRLLFPVNFKFTYTIYSKKIFPFFTDPLCYYIGNTNWQIYEVISWSVTVVALILLYRWFRKYRTFLRHIKVFGREVPELNSRLDAMLKEDERGKICILQMEDIKMSPFICGFRRQVIVMPDRSFSDSELDMILQHELIHFRKKDIQILLVVQILRCLFWWNPFMYLIDQKIHEVFELANDAELIKDLSKGERIDYCQLLCDAARGTAHHSEKCALAFVHPEAALLKKRVNLIFADGNQKRNKTVFILLTVLVFAMLVSSFFVVTDPASENDFYPPGTENPEDIIIPTKDNAYLIRNGDQYDLYINGEYWETIETLDEWNSELEIVDEKNDIHTFRNYIKRRKK